MCDNVVNEDNLVQCDGCKRFICLQCSNLTSSEARVMGLKGKRTLLYLCPPCREALFQVPQLIKSYDSLREEINSIKTELAQSRAQSYAAAAASAPVAAGAAVGAQAASVSTLNTNTVLEEIMERERRASNVVLVNVEESASDSGSVRKAHDESIVKQVLGEVHGADVYDKVVSVQRLGRREPGKKRPVKVVLKSRQDAISTLKNKSKARKEVRLYDDKTPLQRQELQQLRDVLKMRIEKGETNITIKYVKGAPKIVQKN